METSKIVSQIAAYGDIDAHSYATSIAESTLRSFEEMDFQLPPLEVNYGADFETQQQTKRNIKRRNSIHFEMKEELKTFQQLDKIATAEDEVFSRKKGVVDRPFQLKIERGKHEAQAELKLIYRVLTRKAGDLKEEMQVLEDILNGTFEGDEDEHVQSTLDHPKLGSVEEKMEDLRQEDLEKWCAKRGKTVNQKYTNHEKRMLRKWFRALDYDGSGEVNVEELQDPMLSSGILKTREQVVRVLANVDKNNTMGIDFEEFLQALMGNKLADQSRLKKLQQMSADPYFDIDTLITQERRKKLIKSILKRCEERQHEVDKLYKKYDKPKLTHKEKEQFHIERDLLEEHHAKSIYLHLKYITALDGVIQEKKKFYAERAKVLNDTTTCWYEKEDEKQTNHDITTSPIKSKFNMTVNGNEDNFDRKLSVLRMTTNSREELLEALERELPKSEYLRRPLTSSGQKSKQSARGIDGENKSITSAASSLDMLLPERSAVSIALNSPLKPTNQFHVYAPLPSINIKKKSNKPLPTAAEIREKYKTVLGKK